VQALVEPDAVFTMLQVVEMLEEYFSSGDVAEVARSLAEQVPALHAQCTDNP
jgi:hypothetical protein